MAWSDWSVGGVNHLSNTHGVCEPTKVLDGQGDVHDRHKRTSSRNPKQVYAMKVIRKSDMLRSSQEGHLHVERDFLVASENHRWVVPLISGVQDNHNLCLVMEYMVGGDFLGLLLREGILDEGVAQWYSTETILCVEEAHEINWIHRDVKLDNFLTTFFRSSENLRFWSGFRRPLGS